MSYDGYLEWLDVGVEVMVVEVISAKA